MMKKVISKGVAIDPSAIDASSARLHERKEWMHGESMRFAAPVPYTPPTLPTIYML